MSEPLVHPWNEALWALLESEDRRQGLPHALMLHGPRGLGRASLALHFAAHRLVHDSSDQARATTLFEAATHPDLHVLATEAVQQGGGLFGRYAARYIEERKTPARSGPRTTITIAQVRELSARLATSPGIARSRVALIHPTEAMHLSAANALLKLLEEPPDHTLFVLIAADLGRIPPTIRSRCMVLAVPPPQPAAVLPWLAAQTGLAPPEAGALLWLAGGAPLLAVEMHGRGATAFHRDLLRDLGALSRGAPRPAAAPASWAEQGAPAVIELLLRIVARTLQVQLGVQDGSEGGANEELPLALPTGGLFRLYDRLCRLRRIHDPVLDQQLLLDELAQTLQQAQLPGPVRAPL